MYYEKYKTAKTFNELIEEATEDVILSLFFDTIDVRQMNWKYIREAVEKVVKENHWDMEK